MDDWSESQKAQEAIVRWQTGFIYCEQRSGAPVSAIIVGPECIIIPPPMFRVGEDEPIRYEVPKVTEFIACRGLINTERTTKPDPQS